MKHNLSALWAIAIFPTFLGCAIPQNSQVVSIQAPSPSELRSSADEGMMVHIDPITGQFSQTPAQGYESLKITGEMLNAASTSSEGLIQEPTPIEGGGIQINLQGRFRSPIISTQNPKGEIRNRHLSTSDLQKK